MGGSTIPRLHSTATLPSSQPSQIPGGPAGDFPPLEEITNIIPVPKKSTGYKCDMNITPRQLALGVATVAAFAGVMNRSSLGLSNLLRNPFKKEMQPYDWKQSFVTSWREKMQTCQELNGIAQAQGHAFICSVQAASWKPNSWNITQPSTQTYLQFKPEDFVGADLTETAKHLPQACAQTPGLNWAKSVLKIEECANTLLAQQSLITAVDPNRTKNPHSASALHCVAQAGHICTTNEKGFSNATALTRKIADRRDAFLQNEKGDNVYQCRFSFNIENEKPNFQENKITKLSKDQRFQYFPEDATWLTRIKSKMPSFPIFSSLPKLKFWK